MAFKDRQFVDKNCPALQDILKSVVLELNSVFLQDRRDLIFDVCDSRDVVCDLQFLEDEDINNVPSIYAKPMTLKLLRSKLLQHKWGDAALILLGFAKLHWNKSGLNIYKEISWKVGNEIILHHPAGYNNTEIIVGHKRATGLSFESLDQTHCLIEHVFVLLSNHDFSSAQDQLRYYRMIDKSITNRNRRAKDIQKWSTLNEGYLGLIEYVIWKSITSQEEEVTQLSGSLQQNEENSPQSVAQRAAAHFATVLSVLGI
uniref:Uncharacterized protein n=1 Tax=Ciona savignyi TaxID=51511 RepID=H2YDV1_CIOSA